MSTTPNMAPGDENKNPLDAPPGQHKDSPPAASDSWSFPGASKLQAISRFQIFKGTLSRSNSRSKASGKSHATEFPPTSWELNAAKDEGAGASEWKYDPEVWKKEIVKLKDEVGTSDSKEEEGEEKGKGKEKEEETPPAEATPEPTTLAQKIKQLIDSVPYPMSSSTGTTTPVPESSKKLEDPPVNPQVDSKLAQWLSSSAVMNGVGSTESVWDVLDRLGPSKLFKGLGGGTSSKEEDVGAADPEHSDDKAHEDNPEGIMVYAPLHPDQSSQVELAGSELEYVDEPTTPKPQPDVSKPAGGTVDKDKDKDKNAAKKKKARRSWQPSPTQLSLQATWWGYRVYLPPPVLAVLSDAHLAAAKRGALVTAALKWVVDSIPLTVIPPTLRPTILVLKRVSPFLGYIGAFVAWSWEKIKSQDKGNGVVLTATWLMPMAVVPGTWEPEIHGYAKPIEEKKGSEGKGKEKEEKSNQASGSKKT